MCAPLASEVTRGGPVACLLVPGGGHVDEELGHALAQQAVGVVHETHVVAQHLRTSGPHLEWGSPPSHSQSQTISAPPSVPVCEKIISQGLLCN